MPVPSFSECPSNHSEEANFLQAILATIHGWKNCFEAPHLGISCWDYEQIFGSRDDPNSDSFPVVPTRTTAAQERRRSLQNPQRQVEAPG